MHDMDIWGIHIPQVDISTLFYLTGSQMGSWEPLRYDSSGHRSLPSSKLYESVSTSPVDMREHTRDKKSRRRKSVSDILPKNDPSLSKWIREKWSYHPPENKPNVWKLLKIIEPLSSDRGVRHSLFVRERIFYQSFFRRRRRFLHWSLVP